MSVIEAVRHALDLLTPRDRRLFGISVAIQMSTSLLDLVGVLLIGLVGALAVTTVQSQPPPELVSSLATWVGLEEATPQTLVLVLAGAAAFVLLAKSMISTYLSRRVLTFLANRQALVSARLTKALLSRPLGFLQVRSSQETAYALIAGTGAATSLILGQLAIAATEAALLIILGVALLFVSPWVAVGSIVFFALIALALQRAMGAWAARVGGLAAAADIDSLNAVQEALAAYRELSVSNRRHFYVDRIQELRWNAARVTADTQFIGMLPKYMFEAALVIGGFALAGVLFATQDSIAAVGTLALFLAAATRVMPSLLRLQGAALGLRGAAGGAGPTFELARDLEFPLEAPEPISGLDEVKNRIQRGHAGFDPTVTISDVSVWHPGSDTPALSHISATVKAGTSLAVLGTSGAGKSTLADAILGVVSPSSGAITISGVPPAESIQRWPGAVAYVPQHIPLANNSVRANVALGLPPEAIDDELVWEALERAHLADFLKSKREGLSTHVGEGGVRLSGGQRQRLGIARALYERPRLLVLDEATSALDATTEDAISTMIAELEGSVTTIIVAHRLSTIRNVDNVLYLESGRLIEQGTFDEVCRTVPELARQAHLMGLR